MQRYSIKIKGAGTKEEIIDSLQRTLNSIHILEDRADWEDHILMTAIRTEDEDYIDEAFGYGFDDLDEQFQEMIDVTDDRIPLWCDKLTDEMKQDVLHYLLRKGDCSVGVNWDFIQFAIGEVLKGYKEPSTEVN